MNETPNATQQTKPTIWKRWWVWIIIIALAVWAAQSSTQTPDAPDDSGTTAAPTTTQQPDSTPQENEEAEQKPAKLHERFLEKFEASYGTPVGDLTNFNPQDRDSGHYRTEYRLGAYEASTGASGTIGDMTIEMVEYGGYGKPEKNHDFRVYLTGPEGSVVAAYPALAKSMDPSLTDEAIDAALAKFKETPGAIVTDALTLDDSSTAIRNDTISRTGESVEVYIDADTTKWD